MIDNKFKISVEKERQKRISLVIFSLKIGVLVFAALFVILCVALIIDLAGAGIEYTLEAGDPLPSSDELSDREGTEYDFGNYDGIFDKVGTYKFYILDGSRKFSVKLKVEDTKAPLADAISLNVNLAGPYPDAIDFFNNIVEPSGYSAKYLNKVDMSTEGTKEVQLQLSDEHGNAKKYLVYVTMIADKEAPRISAPSTITTYLGEAVAYTKGVTVTDNCFGEPTLSVNADSANTDRVGNYKITYTAKDAAGNTSTLSVTLSVLEKRVTREELMQKVGGLATSLGITEELSKEEKVKLIYAYTNSPKSSASEASIIFTDESNTDRSDWIREAYLTLERGSGDCYSYFAVSKAFFEYFGIDNKDIQRSAGVTTQSGTHFWSMVNIGTNSAPKWYYYDATRLAAKHKTGSGCLFTEAQLEHYNTKVKVGFLTYDHTGYPTVSETVINENYSW